MKPTQYDAEIDSIDNQVDGLNEKRRELTQKRAEVLAPVKVGDIIKNTRNGKFTKITRIKSNSLRGFMLVGADKKKDGTWGTNRELWWYD